MQHTPDMQRKLDVLAQTRQLIKQADIKGKRRREMIDYVSRNGEVPEELRQLDGYVRIPDAVFPQAISRTVTYPSHAALDGDIARRLTAGWQMLNESDPARGNISVTRVVMLGVAGARKGKGKITVTWFHPATETVSS
jgi:hypothetical protein